MAGKDVNFYTKSSDQVAAAHEEFVDDTPVPQFLGAIPQKTIPFPFTIEIKPRSNSNNEASKRWKLVCNCCLSDPRNSRGA